MLEWNILSLFWVVPFGAYFTQLLYFSALFINFFLFTHPPEKKKRKKKERKMLEWNISYFRH